MSRRKQERDTIFNQDWQNFYKDALYYFDGYLHPNDDGIRPGKRDRKRLKALFDILKKGH